MYSWEEIGKHDRKEDAWVVVEDKVYNVSKFVDKHPGGPKIILHRAGRMATETF